MLEEYIQEKRVEEDFACRLRQLAENDRECILQLLSSINPSANSLRGILQLAEEIAQRDKKALHEIFLSSDVVAVLNAVDASRKEKQKKLRRELESLRYPEMRRLHTLIQTKQTQAIRDSGVKFELPEDLEGDAIQIMLTARSPQEIFELSERLKRLGEHPCVEEIFLILQGRW